MLRSGVGSAKQKRVEIRQKRKEKEREASARASEEKRSKELQAGATGVNREALAPSNSYGTPEFVARGYYVDIPFTCVDCASKEVWTGPQQKWWYEVAKGYVYSTAKRCRACRRKRRPVPRAE